MKTRGPYGIKGGNICCPNGLTAQFSVCAGMEEERTESNKAVNALYLIDFDGEGAAASGQRNTHSTLLLPFSFSQLDFNPVLSPRYGGLRKPPGSSLWYL